MRTARLAALCLVAAIAPVAAGPADGAGDLVTTVESARVVYRAHGEWMRAGTPVNGPLEAIAADGPITLMTRQVTAGAYGRCVAAGACAPLDRVQDPELPVTGVSFVDAEAYARWLSAETGERWRLPTDREWALAAGSRYADDAYTEVSDPADPSRRWLATYAAESARSTEAVAAAPRPAGSFGVNENGLADMAGNVWEWTSTCFVRHQVDPKTGAIRTHENCGVRIAEGRHRAYMIAFFRDPKAGACSVGVPPANLGIRLVREERSVIGTIGSWLGF